MGLWPLRYWHALAVRDCRVSACNRRTNAYHYPNWVQKDAAELLSISPRVINYKIKTLGIEFPRGRRAAPLVLTDSLTEELSGF